MKKIISFLLMLFLAAGLQTTNANIVSLRNSSEIVCVKNSKDIKDEKTQKLLARLNEIKDIDKTQLSLQDKRALRKEVLSIKQALNRESGVIVISATALIIIILLIVLL